MSKINNYKAVLKRDAIAEAPPAGHFSIEHSFYGATATGHEMIFFHALASAMVAVLLIVMIKGQTLLLGMVSLFGAASAIVLFIVSMIMLLLAVYFFAISVLKLGATLSKFQINGTQIKTLYAIAGVFGYFLIFTILALILI